MVPDCFGEMRQIFFQMSDATGRTVQVGADGVVVILCAGPSACMAPVLAGKPSDLLIDCSDFFQEVRLILLKNRRSNALCLMLLCSCQVCLDQFMVEHSWESQSSNLHEQHITWTSSGFNHVHIVIWSAFVWHGSLNIPQNLQPHQSSGPDLCHCDAGAVGFYLWGTFRSVLDRPSAKQISLLTIDVLNDIRKTHWFQLENHFLGRWLDFTLLVGTGAFCLRVERFGLRTCCLWSWVRSRVPMGERRIHFSKGCLSVGMKSISRWAHKTGHCPMLKP